MRALILSILLIISLSTLAQHYGDTWQFGNKVGLHFSDCQPTLISGANVGFEGCAALSDSTGQLLFYTNSDTVWNKNHQAMPNGYLIGSTGTLSQVVAIKKPGSTNMYYIITTNIQGGNTFKLQYHEVDMLLNSGLGDVTNKNVVMSTLKVTEQIAATYHSNGNDIWLVTHEYATNQFLAFKVSSSGISTTPVISVIGPTPIPCTSNFNARGEIKFSPNGLKLAYNANGIGTNDSTNALCLFDFDPATGIVSNPLNLPFSRGEFGLSFSADNSKLYGSTWKAFSFNGNDSDYLYQFDLSSGNANTIINSKVLLDSSGTFGSLKLGPDGKVYVRRPGTRYIGVINQPNVAGAACDYVKTGIDLGTLMAQYGLNHYIEYGTACDVVEGLPALNQNQWKVYPNPSNGLIFVQSNHGIQQGHVVVRDGLGRIISQNSFTGTACSIAFNSFLPGLYYVEIYEEEVCVARQKLVLQP